MRPAQVWSKESVLDWPCVTKDAPRAEMACLSKAPRRVPSVKDNLLRRDPAVVFAAALLAAALVCLVIEILLGR